MIELLNNQTLLTGGGLIALLTLVYKANKDNSDKIGRVYQRLDNVKGEANDTYTRKDVCTVVHESVSKDLKEIKQDVKSLVEYNKKNGKG